jgi:hypothetical protein
MMGGPVEALGLAADTRCCKEAVKVEGALVREALGACERARPGDTLDAGRYIAMGRTVVTFGRLYLSTLVPTRDYTPPASKVTWISRLVRAFSTSWTKV